MTISRLTGILAVAMIALDEIFNDGRRVGGLPGQAMRFGYWLSDELSGLAHYISSFH